MKRNKNIVSKLEEQLEKERDENKQEIHRIQRKYQSELELERDQ